MLVGLLLFGLLRPFFRREGWFSDSFLGEELPSAQLLENGPSIEPSVRGCNQSGKELFPVCSCAGVAFCFVTATTGT